MKAKDGDRFRAREAKRQKKKVLKKVLFEKVLEKNLENVKGYDPDISAYYGQYCRIVTIQ